MKERAEQTRKIAVDTKMGATAVAFMELKDLLNTGVFAKLHMGMTSEEFDARLEATTLRHHGDEFSEEQFSKITEAFRTIATQLNKAADEIDEAPNE